MSDAPPAAPTATPAEDPAPSSVPASTRGRGRGSRYIFLAILSLGVLAADLGSKAWAVNHLERDGFRLPAKEIIRNHLWLTLARNPGGAWGMLHDQPEKVRKPFFVVVSVVAVIVIVTMFRKLDPKQRALKWGLPLVLGGALGNLVDRIRFSQVIDFIDVVYWRKRTGAELHWPTFNVADIAICIGVFLMAIDFLFPHRRPAPRRLATMQAPDTPPDAKVDAKPTT